MNTYGAPACRQTGFTLSMSKGNGREGMNTYGAPACRQTGFTLSMSKGNGREDMNAHEAVYPEHVEG